MSKARDVDALAGAIGRLIEALIAQDQGKIGVHETVTMAQTDLRDALKRVLGVKLEAGS